MSFIHEAGIPQTIITDNAREETKGDWQRTCRHHGVQQKQTVPHSPWQNRAEQAIRELKVAIRRTLRRTRAPRRLWCYCGEWVAAIRRLTALPNPKLEGRTGEEKVNGSTPDITPYCLFDWFSPVYYHDPTKDFPYQKKSIGMWIGVEVASTEIMAFRILQANGEVVVRKSVWGISEDEMKQPNVAAEIAELQLKLEAKIGDSVSDTDIQSDLLSQFPEIPDYIFDEEEIADEPEESENTRPEANDYTPDSYDQYINAEVLLPYGGEELKAKVKARKHDADGLPLGKRHANPLLDTREYEVEFPDGSVDFFTANTIAENIFSQVDQEGRRSYSILDSIVDHRKNGHALSKDDGLFTTKSGRKVPKRTTRGWELQCMWKDGTTSWLPVKDLKESNPIEVAEYAISNKIAEEPAFAWWVRKVLRHRDRILGKVKSKYWSKTHKFGIEFPKSVAEALAIDKRTGTDFWRKAIDKEMRNEKMN
jgi:hypothetical protein